MAEQTTTVIVSNVPVPLVDALKRISDAWDRSLSAEIRRALREYIEAHEYGSVHQGERERRLVVVDSTVG